MYKLTKTGIENCKIFIQECQVKRKEILDAGIDAAADTILPTLDDIESDIEEWVDDAGDYYNSWGVTDNYDLPCHLELGVDFVLKESEV